MSAIFTGANKQSFVADYQRGLNLVAYGAATNIALWDPLGPSSKGVFSTLKAHSKEVTGVRFIPNSPYLVSIGEDGKTVVWESTEGSRDPASQKDSSHTDSSTNPINTNPKISDNTQQSSLLSSPFIPTASFEDHSLSVTCIAACADLFVTGGADGRIVVRMGPGFDALHTFTVATGFYPLALAIQAIGGGKYVLAVAGTNTKVHIYTFTKDSLDKACVLPGHEDWVKCLAFVRNDADSYILASGGQDRYIRLWRLFVGNRASEAEANDPTTLTLLQNKVYGFSVGGTAAAFTFEALIMGHDDWVTGMEWKRIEKRESNSSMKSGENGNVDDELVNQSSLQLLSSSADTALMVWEMDELSGIWVCVHRLGEMSIKGASTATGSTGGFWTCLWMDDVILTSGKTGSFRMYRKNNGTYEAVRGVTGPVREVTDVVWDPTGQYLMATSLDQTTRLFAQWNNEYASWHEYARPQIHGYDMICLDNVSPTKFVSGGDEKVLRVFEMTESIAALLRRLCGISVDATHLPEAASLPVLGLSNKAANEQLEVGEAAQRQQNHEESVNEETAHDDVLLDLCEPPLEDHLQRYTLFPELDKLYGHGYEITCCATSRAGLIASACRSNTAKHAVVRLFDSGRDFQQLSTVLSGHNLTITSLEFSRDGRHLLVVSRDRQLSLWRVKETDGPERYLFELIVLQQAHSRIIWDCAWVSDTVFVTGSRDKHIKMWRVGTGIEMIASVKLSEPVTSVSVHPHVVDGTQAMAVGLESGGVHIFRVGESMEFEQELSEADTPSARINKLAFSPRSDKLVLGVGSADCSARIYDVSRRET